VLVLLTLERSAYDSNMYSVYLYLLYCIRSCEYVWLYSLVVYLLYAMYTCAPDIFSFVNIIYLLAKNLFLKIFHNSARDFTPKILSLLSMFLFSLKLTKSFICFQIINLVLCSCNIIILNIHILCRYKLVLSIEIYCNL